MSIFCFRLFSEQSRNDIASENTASSVEGEDRKIRLEIFQTVESLTKTLALHTTDKGAV